MLWFRAVLSSSMFCNESDQLLQMIQKLSTRQPSLEIRQRVTKEIAAETGIDLKFYDPSSEDAGVRITNIPIHPASRHTCHS